MIKVELSALKESKPQEYLVRFVFGGACTVLAGLIAKHFGPAIGGLFLAFPAIFPAGASLIESHEKRRKAKIGCDGTNRGRLAASVDSAGAALGCVGLCVFALILWWGIPRHNAYAVITFASIIWACLSSTLWSLRRYRIFHCVKRSALRS
jgi:Protein of unknown function (DUF3147)